MCSYNQHHFSINSFSFRRFLSIIFFAVFIQSFPLNADGKVLIFTYSYNCPEFIEMQHKTFKKFLIDEYEFVVFNDAVNSDHYKAIHETCDRLNVKCIDIPQEIHHSFNASDRNGAVVDYSLRNYGFDHNGIVALFDSDLFLVKSFSIKKHMFNAHLSGLYQDRMSGSYIADYLWIGLVFLDMTKLIDKRELGFSPTKIDGVIGVDTGGYSHYYLRNHRSIPVRFVNQRYMQESWHILTKDSSQGSTSISLSAIGEAKRYGGFNNDQIEYILDSGPTDTEFLCDAHFVHYRGGTNWDEKSSEIHTHKIHALRRYIDRITEKKCDDAD